ncbi:MAG: hypothetical protein LBH92_00970 [Bacteroidales bacterium]|jgi:hypothetical protein|nr:hypothetical protein [Bacteroidales bacterium]
MELQKRIDTFAKLGLELKKITSDSSDFVSNKTAQLKELIEDSKHYNPWFTSMNVQFCLENWGDALTEENLHCWLKKYSFPETNTRKKVGIIMAGNIPMVGFHDFISVLLTGHQAIVKLSSLDNKLLPAIFEILTDIDPALSDQVVFTNGLMKEADAFIATGSNNSARYFDFYFQKYPHIIRRHRNSVAVLTGEETTEYLKKLGEDIFRYFGLGCRNISKLFVPENYDFNLLIEILSEWRYLDDHHKYHNNFDYNKAIALVNRDEFIDGGFFILKPNAMLSSPVSVIHYEYYQDWRHVQKELYAHAESIQCVASCNDDIPFAIPFGKAQKPDLWDYADGIDAIHFLLNI